MILENFDVILTCAIILLLTKYIWDRRRLYVLSWKLPGPISLPFIGVGYKFMCSNEKILGVLKRLIDAYPSPSRMWVGPRLFVVFKDPKNVEMVLTSYKFNHKYDTYEYLAPLLGDGLISGSGQKQKAHRKLIKPLLNQNFITACHPVIEKQLDILIENLNKRIDKGTYNVEDDIHPFVADVVGITILGKKLNSQTGQNQDFIKSLEMTQQLAYSQIVKPWYRWKFYANKTQMKASSEKGISTIHALLGSCIEMALNAVKTGTVEEQKIDGFKSFIFKLASLADKQLIAKEDLLWEMSTLHGASEDTLTITIAFGVMCFGLYPEYQEKAVKEIEDVLGNEDYTLEDLYKLKYLDMCIKEFLRLATIGPYILRRCTQDFEINGVFYPKECGIVIPVFNILRDPLYWENPEHFHPDHFLPEVVEKRPVYAYTPFSAGTRGCIGKVYVMTVMRLSLIKILRNFRIEADGKLPDVPIKADISVRAVHGYFVRLTPRHQNSKK